MQKRRKRRGRPPFSLLFFSRGKCYNIGNHRFWRKCTMNIVMLEPLGVSEDVMRAAARRFLPRAILSNIAARR